MTALTTFLRPLRSVLNDNDPDVPIFEDDQLIDALRSVLQMGRVPGFTLSDDELNTDIELSWKTDSRNFARLVMHSAKLFVVGITRTSFNTRAFSESIGEPKELVDAVIQEVYALDSAEKCL